ncbi:MAG: hypothetical protein ABJY83_19685 [Roseibium sp.]
MTFDEKMTKVNLAKSIGEILDGEGTQEDLKMVAQELEKSEDGKKLLRQLAGDQRLLMEAIPAEMPKASMAGFLRTIDREFGHRPPARKPHINWTQAVVRLAASLVLVAGTFAATNYWMQSRMDQAVANLAAHMETERLLLAQTVQDALETRISGEPLHISQDGDWSDVLTPIKTYKSKSGHWCRQYLRETTIGKMGLTIRGTACRDENGLWTTVFAEPASENSVPDTPGI